MKIKRLLIACAVFLLSFTAFDYGVSGPITIKDVEFKAKNISVQPLRVSLPYIQRSSSAGDEYLFAFTLRPSYLDYLFPLRLVPDDCIRNLRIDGMLIDLAQFASVDLCNITQGIPIDALRTPGNSSTRFEVLLEDKGRIYGLKVVRFNILSPLQRVFIILTALYLFSLATVHQWSEWRRLHYVWLVTAFFILSFLPRNFYLQLWWPWINFLGNGLAVAFIAYLGAFWKPVKPFYAFLDSTLRKIIKIQPHWFGLCAVTAFFILTGSLSQILFDGLPHIDDTHMHYAYSKIIAEGKLYDISHPLRHFFDSRLAFNNGKYFSAYFPGHAFLLAVGQLMGVPWLVNPLLGALTVGAVFFLANELAGRSAAYTASVLMLASPAIVFMSSEYMNHVSTTFFLILFLYAYIRTCKTGDWRFAVLAGCSVGYAFLTRVQSTVPFALPVAFHAAWIFFRNPRATWQQSLIMLGSFSLLVVYLMYYNYRTMGNPIFPGSAYNPTGLMFLKFFSASRWAFLGGDISRAVSQMQGAHSQIFGWPTSSLWGVFLLLLFAKRPKYTSLLYACFFGQFLGLMFVYPDHGYRFFPRYIYESYPVVVVLTALCIQKIVQKLTTPATAFPIPHARATVFLTVGCLIVMAFPSRIIDLYRTYNNNYAEGNWGYYYTLTHSVRAPALVFVTSDVFRLVYFMLPPRDDSPVIVARDRGRENSQLMDYYPDRHVYISNGKDLLKIR